MSLVVLGFNSDVPLLLLLLLLIRSPGRLAKAAVSMLYILSQWIAYLSQITATTLNVPCTLKTDKTIALRNGHKHCSLLVVKVTSACWNTGGSTTARTDKHPLAHHEELALTNIVLTMNTLALCFSYIICSLAEVWVTSRRYLPSVSILAESKMGEQTQAHCRCNARVNRQHVQWQSLSWWVRQIVQFCSFLLLDWGKSCGQEDGHKPSQNSHIKHIK